MAMTYTSLVASKGAAGSLANWVSYSKLDTATILDEAQSLLYQLLRVREMRSEMFLKVAVGGSQIVLPPRFLDPVTPLVSTKNGIELRYKTPDEVQRQRVYEHLTGTLGTDAVSTATNTTVSVALPNHGLTIGSDFSISGATPIAPLGIDVNVIGKVVSISNPDRIAVYNPTITPDAAINVGGGAGMTYEANRLIASYPTSWSVWGDIDPLMFFDAAFEDTDQFRMIYYASPTLLSASNQSNWLTNRYPMLLRKACMAAAADFMKDDAEYTKNLTALTGMVQSINAENDLIYRGAEFGTDTP